MMLEELAQQSLQVKLLIYLYEQKVISSLEN